MAVLWRLAFVLFVFSTPLAVATQEAGTGHPEPFDIPNWFKQSFLDLSEDNLEAQEADKHLLVFFTQDFCPYCKALIEKNLTQKTIRDALDSDFEIVHLNMWGDREVYDIRGELTTEKAIAASLQVQFTPTLIFFDRNGDVALRTNGYISSSEMLASLEYVSTRSYERVAILDFMKNRTVKSASKPLNERGFLKQSFSQYQFGSPIALVFEQTDCVDCDQLHQCVLAKESFDRYVDPFYAVQLDVWNRSPITLPNGRRVSAYDLARELNVTYTPTIILLDETFGEVIRAEARFRSFHIESLFEYVSTGVYREEPQFQRFIDARADQQRARGDTVSILGTDRGCSTL